MYPIQSVLLPPPASLKYDIACIRLSRYQGEQPVAIHVSASGTPGIVFHQHDGYAALDHITTHSGRVSRPPALFLHGPVIEPSVMMYKSTAFTTIQIIFQPYALKTLLGLNALCLARGWEELHDVGAKDLGKRLLEATDGQEQANLLLNYLESMVRPARSRDTLVEESLHFIHTNPGALHIKDLLSNLHISERQFERRFAQTVGLTPHMYLRVKRFNEAMRLLKTERFARLTDVAAALNFSDQSHFIHEVKAFSGMTPTGLLHRGNDFYHKQAGYSYV